ncbi:MAG TPA: hypothetical protein VGQ85_00240 [Candidatus Limnocylindrales bacterium]|nr:hypothetical protein [Candidatus Limnocylindrales bacterium]
MRKLDHDGKRWTVFGRGYKPARISDNLGPVDSSTEWRGAHPRSHWHERVHAPQDGHFRRFL